MMLFPVQPSFSSARKKLVKLQFPTVQCLNFNNHHSYQTLLNGIGVDGVKENGEKLPRYANVTLKWQPQAASPITKPHQLVFTVITQGEKLAKRLYRKHFAHNPTVRSVLEDTRVPFKDWFVKRMYRVNVDPKSLALTVHPEKEMELMLDKNGRDALIEGFKFKAGSSFGIDLLRYSRQVVDRAKALKILEPLK